MARTRRSAAARLRARHDASAFAFAPAGEGETTWLDWRGTELRLRDAGGGLVDSIALPDAHVALGRLEFAAGELAPSTDEGGPVS